eukprot:8780662-Pyramimonas_sp.AAC.2
MTVSGRLEDFGEWPLHGAPEKEEEEEEEEDEAEEGEEEGGGRRSGYQPGGRGRDKSSHIARMRVAQPSS